MATLHSLTVSLLASFNACSVSRQQVSLKVQHASVAQVGLQANKFTSERCCLPGREQRRPPAHQEEPSDPGAV